MVLNKKVKMTRDALKEKKKEHRAPFNGTKFLPVLFKEFIYQCRYSRRRSPETIRSYEMVFATLMKVSPSITTETLTPEKLTQFFEELQTRKRIVGKGEIRIGIKDSTIATYRSKFHSFFEWLVIGGHIPENPLDRLARVNVSYDDHRALRKNDIDKILTAIEIHSRSLLQQKRDKAMAALFVFAGLRRGELLGLNVLDVDLEKLTVKIRKETSKSKSTRLLPINLSLRMLLEDYLQQRSKDSKYTDTALFVSLSKDSRLTNDGLKHWVKRLVDLSGVKFHVHRFRHTFATNLAAQKINAIQLQQLMGHKDLRMTQRYVRSLDAEDLRPAVNGLSFGNLA